MKRTFGRSAALTIGMLFLALSVMSQKVITGRVVDASTKEGIPGATVSIIGSTLGTVTDETGFFKLRTTEKGKETLVFRSLGFEELTQFVELDKDKIALPPVFLIPTSIGLEEIQILASFVKNEGVKPVVVSTVNGTQLENQLSNQEFPEILKSIPSIYTTKQGGGVGDARISLRGFNSDNIGVLINGIPVNGMENGAVYWSNWAGLADVTQSIQVQRGLGVSKLGIPSVGGTVNIITKTIDGDQGGSVYYGMGNDAYQKVAFNLSTGLMKNGWALTLSGSHTTGDGYIPGTDFKAWSYFINLSKRINTDHLLSFTAFGAPQWHNQRGDRHYIRDYENHKDGIKMNTSYGYLNGKAVGASSGYNEYHKPQLALNHFWTINEKSSLSTSVYASISKGGGRGVYGGSFADRQMLLYNTDGTPYKTTALTPDGLLDYNKVMETNKASENGSKAFFVMGTNAHEWYGVLSSYTNRLTESLQLTAGIDGRYYKGFHYQKISDLLGGSYFKENKLAYRDPATELHVGDKVNYDNTSHIFWAGAFSQLEWIRPEYNAFLSISLTEHMYKRVDPGTYGAFGNQETAPVSRQKTDWKCFVPTTIKGGFNYRFAEIHNVFINGGYVTKAPTFDGVFPARNNDIMKDATLEKIATVEIGYGIHTYNLSVNLNGYYTKWMDKTASPKIGTQYVNLTGVDAIHKGVELSVAYRPVSSVNLGGNLSIGNWKWANDADYYLYNDIKEVVGEAHAYIDGLHVGNAPQTSLSLTGGWKPFENLHIGANWNYYARNYADFDPTNRGKEEDKVDSWKTPDYCTVDMHMNYRFKIGSIHAILYGNVNNLFDKKYIADAKDGINHDRETALVWYGFGTTWTAGLKIAF